MTALRLPRILLGLLTALVVTVAMTPVASADRAFSARYSTNDQGDVVITGNTVLTCPASDANCAATQAGTNTTSANDDYTMTNVDVDGDVTTFNSSRADVTVPSGATVLWAGLYWGADTSGSARGNGAPDATLKNTVKFSRPGLASYTTVNSSQLDTDQYTPTRFQGFANVTAQVQAGGSGTYGAANVQAGLGGNRYGGWSLVVAYRDTTAPERNMRIYDGFQTVTPTGAASIALPGILTPSTGPVKAKLGLVGWEGDLSLATESATLAGSNITDAGNPANNLFNSSVSNLGTLFTAKNPNYANQLGVDADVINVDGVIAPGATSATVALSTTQDQFMPGVLTLASDATPRSPSAAGAPVVTGTARDGSTLATTNGTWGGTVPMTYAYQWKRCDAAGAGCVDIAGATGSSYTLGSADAGRTVRVAVTATNGGGSLSQTSNQTGTVSAVAPANVVLPGITGTARDGQTLTSSQGSWTGTTPLSFTYQWKRCDASGAGCVDIAGATGSTYTLVGADTGKTVRTAVTATNPAGFATATTAQTGAVAVLAPANTALPTVSGTVRDGSTLTTTDGTWSGTAPLTFTYQWKRCDTTGAGCVDIAGASSTSYTLVSADAGRTVRATVTAINSAGSAAATSAQTATVASIAPANLTVPVLSGTPRDGQTVAATDGTWSGTAPLTFTYQWKRCDTAGAGCVDIAGATGSTYTLVAADAGRKIRAAVTATNPAGNATASSAPTATVAAVAPANAVLPTLSGTAGDGQTLTASNGSWTGTTPLSFSYQWKRCDTAGANCVDITGATGSTYTLVSADSGRTIRAAVTATNTAGNATATSAQTATVSAITPSNTELPTVTGTARDGQTLTTTNGTWSGTTPLSFSYQWKRCDTAGAGCVDIASATSSSYTLAAADAGRTIRSSVTATNAAGNATASSAATGTVGAVAPANTAAPVVSGTARDGSTLSTTDGSWSGTTPLSYTYQWQRCDTAGANCADITGAASSSYTLVSADTGKTVRSSVTATNSAGTAGANSIVTGSVAAVAPVNVVSPSITGVARDGQTLSSTQGGWTGTTPLTYSYQWKRCDTAGANCADITGAIGSTYALVSADTGRTIRTAVTATNTAGNATATTTPSATVSVLAPANTTVPAVSGTVRDGSTLTTTNGAWTGTAPLSYTYQWQRCNAAGAACADIASATGSSYSLVSADTGKTVRSTVTATNSAGNASANSSPTSTVAAVAPANVVLPGITGTPRDGQILTSSQGGWSGTTPMTFAYQWKRCDTAGANCADISGATDFTYTLVSADASKTVRAVVTATNVAGSSSATTTASGTVAAVAPTSTVAPALSGTSRDGQTLTADRGTFTGTTPMTYTYQWQRCDAAGANCADITGTTGPSYDLAGADVDKTVRVLVTATNAGGTETRSSSPSAPIAARAPVNTVAPSTAGAARDGDTLTGDRGTWTGTAPITYANQWQRCDASGANCADVTGATGGTYTLVSADAGKTVKLVVTATNAAASTSASSPRTGVVAAVAPAGTSDAPSVSGTVRDGQTLTADHGTFSGTTPMTYGFQWQRCDAAGANCVNIPSATDGTYDLTSDDVGRTIRVVVRATNAAGNDVETSSPTNPVAALAPTNDTAPALSGSTADGDTLTAGRGGWSGTTPMTYDFRWQRCDAAGANCADITGATVATYKLTSADVGRTVRALVTATNAGGSSSKTSAPSGAVTATAPSSTLAPSETGAPRDGATLTADRGLFSGTTPMTYDFQWQRCDAAGANCVNIPSATDGTYDLTSDDVGRTIRVVVKATNAGGSDTRNSDASSPIAARPPVNTVAPSISGTLREGEVASADRGTWSGTTPMTAAYQWQRCDAAGSGCADIADATGTTYTLVTGDVDATLRIVVTETNAAGHDSASSSPSSKVGAQGPGQGDAPAITGDALVDEVLTADHGTFSGSGLSYSYQWQRCDQAGNNCADIPDATSPTYRLAAADLGLNVRVSVTATNAGGSQSAISNLKGLVENNDNVGLETLPGSLIAPGQCGKLITNRGILKAKVAGAGKVVVHLDAKATVTPSAPLGVSTKGSARTIKSIEYRLDGRLVGRATRAPWAVGVRPALLKAGLVQKLTVLITPRRRPKGKPAKPLMMPISSAKCAGLYTATMRSGRTRSVKLRIDSRAAIGQVGFTLPSALLPATVRGRKAVKVGFTTIVMRGNRRRTYPLMAGGKGFRGLLVPAGVDRPAVTLKGGKLTLVTPAGTGRLEVVLNLPAAKKLAASARRAKAMTLKAKLSSGRPSRSAGLTALLSLPRR